MVRKFGGKRVREEKPCHASRVDPIYYPFISGLTLVIIEGVNSTLGLWHYKMGLLATILFTVHVIKRIPILYKTIKWFKSI